MKKLLLILPLALGIAATAQTAKPSVGVAHQPAATTAEQASPALAQPETTDLALPPGTPVYMKLETPISTILKHLHDPPPIDAARVPDSLRPVLRSALAKEPEGRYPTEMLGKLANCRHPLLLPGVQTGLGIARVETSSNHRFEG